MKIENQLEVMFLAMGSDVNSPKVVSKTGLGKIAVRKKQRVDLTSNFYYFSQKKIPGVISHSTCRRRNGLLGMP